MNLHCIFESRAWYMQISESMVMSLVDVTLGFVDYCRVTSTAYPFLMHCFYYNKLCYYTWTVAKFKNKIIRAAKLGAKLEIFPRRFLFGVCRSWCIINLVFIYLWWWLDVTLSLECLSIVSCTVAKFNPSRAAKLAISVEIFCAAKFRKLQFSPQKN